MAANIKVEKTKEVKGEKVSFGNDDYVVIKLKSDGVLYPEHKILADKLVKKGLAELDKTAKIEPMKSNTVILEQD